jgi:galactokinase
MSSSAALVIGALIWLNSAFELNQEPLALARIGQKAETRGTGVRVGILDQAASVLGRPGQAVLIDCRTLSYQHIPFQLPDTGLLICETGVERSLAHVGYNERRAQCEAAVAAFQAEFRAEGQPRDIKALRDITERDYQRLAGDVPEPARRRARHVIGENMRTLTAAVALGMGQAEVFGNLVLASHASLRDDYEVSCPELDAVVEIATGVPGGLGARLVGAGFGGSALIVAKTDALEAITARLQQEYPRRTHKRPTLHRITPAGGTGTATIGAN